MNENIIVKFSKTTPDARVPTYSTSGAGAFDFYANEDVVIPYNGVTKIPTGIRAAIPEGWVMLIVPRSSIGLKTTMRMPNSVGVIDSDYRGEIMGLYENNKDAKQQSKIRKGDRIAQGFLVKVPRIVFEEVDKLSTTERGTGGFGSTGGISYGGK